MNNLQISEKYDIPLSTVYDWAKPDHNKYKVYLCLKESLISKPKKSSAKRHRILHILNRNINGVEKYSFDEVKEAFDITHFDSNSRRHRIIASKFFKECDLEDLDSLTKNYGISIRGVKYTYSNSPEKKLRGVQKKWNRRFRLPAEERKITAKPIPDIVLQLLQARNTNV